jgi:hypothetical protein
MSATVLEHPPVRGYLRRLNAACIPLPVAQARELRDQIAAHLDEALAPDADDDEVAAEPGRARGRRRGPGRTPAWPPAAEPAGAGALVGVDVDRPGGRPDRRRAHVYRRGRDRGAA